MKVKTAVTAAVVALLLVALPATAATIITGAQVRNNSLTGKDVRNKSLTRQDFRGSVRGPRGFQGPAGPAGPAGSVSRVTEVESPEVTLQPGQSTFQVAPNGFRAQCPAGSTAVGTGFSTSVATIGFVMKFGTFVGGYAYNDSSIAVGVTVQAICAFGPSDALAASASAASDRREFRAAVRRAEAAR